MSKVRGKGQIFIFPFGSWFWKLGGGC